MLSAVSLPNHCFTGQEPHIDFCSIVWGNSCLSNKMKIFRLQYRACHVILDCNVKDSSEAMQSLKILSVYDRIFLRKAKFMFKVYNGLTPSYISENFTLRNEMDMSVYLRSSASASITKNGVLQAKHALLRLFDLELSPE